MPAQESGVAGPRAVYQVEAYCWGGQRLPIESGVGKSVGKAEELQGWLKWSDVIWEKAVEFRGHRGTRILSVPLSEGATLCPKTDSVKEISIILIPMTDGEA